MRYPPLRYYLERVLCDMGGGISHWAANQGPLNGGVSSGGVSRSGLVFLFCPFWDFPDFSGIFPICSGMVRGFSQFALFLFLGLLRAPTRNSPERVRDTIWTFSKKSGKHPGLETPRFSFSQAKTRPHTVSIRMNRLTGSLPPFKLYFTQNFLCSDNYFEGSSQLWLSIIDSFEPIKFRSGPANQNKERSVHELFAGAFRNKSSM